MMARIDYINDPNASAILLYGPPASGKDTITDQLLRLDSKYLRYQRLKAGSGRTTGYRIVDEDQIYDLQRAGEILWINRRYGAIYAVDKRGLEDNLKNGVPIIHLGQAEAISALINSSVSANWYVVELQCDREETQRRLHLRNPNDLDERLTAWDETTPLAKPNLRINTAHTDPGEAAKMINEQFMAFQSGFDSTWDSAKPVPDRKDA